MIRTILEISHVGSEEENDTFCEYVQLLQGISEHTIYDHKVLYEDSGNDVQPIVNLFMEYMSLVLEHEDSRTVQDMAFSERAEDFVRYITETVNSDPNYRG